MVDCPKCGAFFSADAAERMLEMAIVAYADCPHCGHTFVPLLDDCIRALKPSECLVVPADGSREYGNP